MNDTPKSDSSDTDIVDVTATVKSSSKNGAKKISRAKMVGSLNIIHVLLIGLAILLLAQWWSSTSQINQLREELARRLQATDVSTAETKTLTKSILETDKELQVKLGVLERKQTESESHAVALQQLYQDLSKNRDDWALSEIEQVLSTASQQLQLAGNVQGALIALQNADARLARSDKPQFITIRRSIARDIDRLKALPSLDLPGIALRLDNAIVQVENMPLLVNETPAEPLKASQAKSTKKTADKKDKTTPATEAYGWKIWLSEHWQTWSTAMWKEMHQLVRIRNVDNPQALLLAPDQAYFIKENVKLRLLNARLALLSRNETVFKNDLVTAQKEITQYFDTRAKQTQAVQALLRQIQNSNISIEMPSLADSLNAVRNFTVKQ
jgi:uroporphyrin-III C-methyltransferase